MGEFRTEQWGARAENTFYTVKGVAEHVLHRFGIDAYSFVPLEHPTFHPYRTAAVTIRHGEEERVVGIVGEINAEVSAAFRHRPAGDGPGAQSSRSRGSGPRHTSVRAAVPSPGCGARSGDCAGCRDSRRARGEGITRGRRRPAGKHQSL